MTDAASGRYWSVAPERLLASLESSENGLQVDDAAARLQRYGPNTIKAQLQSTALRLLLRQFRSPLVLILIFAAIVSGVVGEWIDASIVLAIVFGSTFLGFLQEYSASNAVEKLRSQITIRSSVLRGGVVQMLPSEQLVPGDIVILSAGSLIPADGIVLDAKDFFVNQAVLTGETFPVEKKPATLAENSSLAQRTNCVFMGTSAGSGTARVLIVATASSTVFGQVAERLRLRPPETEFERGIRQFGNLLTQVMLVMVVVVLAVNVFLEKPLLDSLLFALALAVGLSPELLPAIISITLSHGAQEMAKRGVIVRRLNSIENFGSMDVLCTDKTGTLTEGVVRLDGAFDTDGKPSRPCCVTHTSTRTIRPDWTIRSTRPSRRRRRRTPVDIGAEPKVDEIPYDFVRKRLSVVVRDGDETVTLVARARSTACLSVCVDARRGRHSASAGRRDAGRRSAALRRMERAGLSRARRCRRNASKRAPVRTRRPTKRVSHSPASCCSSIRRRPTCRRSSSISRNAACS